MPVNELGIVSSFVVHGPSIMKRETYGQIIEPVLNQALIDSEEYMMNTGIDEHLLPEDMRKLKNVHCMWDTYAPTASRYLYDSEGENKIDNGYKFTEQVLSGVINYAA
jgi:hypothetical protein